MLAVLLFLFLIGYGSVGGEWGWGLIKKIIYIFFLCVCGRMRGKRFLLIPCFSMLSHSAYV